MITSLQEFTGAVEMLGINANSHHAIQHIIVLTVDAGYTLCYVAKARSKGLYPTRNELWERVLSMHESYMEHEHMRRRLAKEELMYFSSLPSPPSLPRVPL
jgi:hypothetical protein